jgi:large subunit ribosomal protein L17
MVRDRFAVLKLFDEIGPRYLSRPGGYTRLVKVGPRMGDAAPMSILELIPADGAPAKKEEAPAKAKGAKAEGSEAPAKKASAKAEGGEKKAAAKKPAAKKSAEGEKKPAKAKKKSDE